MTAHKRWGGGDAGIEVYEIVRHEQRTDESMSAFRSDVFMYWNHVQREEAKSRAIRVLPFRALKKAERGIAKQCEAGRAPSLKTSCLWHVKPRSLPSGRLYF